MPLESLLVAFLKPSVFVSSVLMAYGYCSVPSGISRFMPSF